MYYKRSVVCSYMLNVIPIVVSKIVVMNVFRSLKHRSQAIWELPINGFIQMFIYVYF